VFPEIKGLDGLLGRLAKLSQLKELTGGLKLVAAHIIGILQKHPTVSRRSQPFKTQKQRRYFFWALREGKIEVPYRRGSSPGSRNLKQRWRVVVESPTRVVAENNTSYAALVHKAGSQAFYHKTTGWPTDADALREARPLAVTVIRQRVDKILAGVASE